MFDTPELRAYEKKRSKNNKIKEWTYKIFSLGMSGKTTKTLIYLNIFVFVLELLFKVGMSMFIGFPISSPLFMFWQPFTSMFLHGGWIHLIVNMVALWSIAKPLEEMWGNKKLLIFYLLCGLFSGLLCALIFPLPVVGASGAICGLLSAFAWLNPNTKILLFFVIPAKTKPAVIWFGVISLILGIASLINPVFGFGIAHFGHLGGLLAGVGLMYFWKKRYLTTSSSVF